jgi:hypothetical protein
MCCMATFYLRGLLEYDLLVNSGKVQKKMISRVTVISRKDATEVGGDGRKHIMDTTIKTNECKLDVPVFDSLIIAIH